MIVRHLISLFSHSWCNLSLPPHFSPCHICLTQPVWQHSMLKHSQGRWSKSAVNSHYNALIWCFLTSQACCQGPSGYFTSFPSFSLYVSLFLCLSVCANTSVEQLQLKIWLFLWSCLHMNQVGLFEKTDGLKPNSKLSCYSGAGHFKSTLLLQHNYCPSFTCCFKYCFRVNHSLVLI